MCMWLVSLGLWIMSRDDGSAVSGFFTKNDWWTGATVFIHAAKNGLMKFDDLWVEISFIPSSKKDQSSSIVIIIHQKEVRFVLVRSFYFISFRYDRIGSHLSNSIDPILPRWHCHSSSWIGRSCHTSSEDPNHGFFAEMQYLSMEVQREHDMDRIIFWSQN